MPMTMTTTTTKSSPCVRRAILLFLLIGIIASTGGLVVGVYGFSITTCRTGHAVVVTSPSPSSSPLLASRTAAVRTSSTRRQRQIIRNHGWSLYAIRCEEKFYQLEEMEDKETCTTELYLKSDRTVQFGQTDGPLFLDATGSWQVKPGTNDFTMVLSRTYGTGSSARDMGEFQYDVRRTYVGEMTEVGASVGITGVAHTLGPSVDGNQEVGFFNMIDATDLRESYSKDEQEGQTGGRTAGGGRGGMASTS